jgi:hypothetical protein
MLSLYQSIGDREIDDGTVELPDMWSEVVSDKHPA